MKTYKLILGTAQMGLNYGINNFNGKITKEQSNNILYNAYKSGIDSLDTAELYGNAHHTIGDFHKKNPGVKFKINTKFPHNFNYKNLENKIYDYLDILKVDSIETIMFHSFDSYFNNIDSIKSITELKHKGYVNHIGVSVYNNNEIEDLLKNKEVSVIQLPFNLFDNNYLRGEILKKIKAADKIVHTRSAFLQGLFFKNLNHDDSVVKGLYDELKYLNELSAASNKSIAEIALGYCIFQDNIDKVIIGVDSIEQLHNNLKIVNNSIDVDLFYEIDKILIKNLDLINPTKWKI